MSLMDIVRSFVCRRSLGRIGTTYRAEPKNERGGIRCAFQPYALLLDRWFQLRLQVDYQQLHLNSQGVISLGGEIWQKHRNSRFRSRTASRQKLSEWRVLSN